MTLGGCIVFSLLCLLSGTKGLARIDPLVETKAGLIRGMPADDGDYSMFLGIPYATVDRANPFGLSIPVEEFEGTFDAIDDSAECPQKNTYNMTVGGVLDCLNLNVYVPRTANSRNRYPVMVYIHGGGFKDGAGQKYIYGPKFLVKHDVVLVTINYRLSVYGFLCLDTPQVPGNQGLKDQLTALRWIKNNIDAFGGDSNKITIFGESAGSLSVEMHLMFTQENLFNNIIMQSASNLMPSTNPGSNIDVPFLLADYLGFETDNLDEALKFLASVDSNDLITAAVENNFRSRICIEKEFDNVERFVTGYPNEISIPKARNVPIMIGFNSNEQGNVFEFVEPEGFKDLDIFSDLNELFDFDEERHAEMVKLIRQFYIGDEEISIDVEQQLVKYYCDFQFFNPTHRSIQKYIENKARSVYHYVFSYEGSRNFNKKIYDNNEYSGALHADELSYLFNVALLNEPITPEDQEMIDKMTTLWTNFAKYGNPNPEASDLLPFQWPTVTKDILYYLDIGSELIVKKRPYHDRMAFWNLFFKLNQEYLRSKVNNDI